jgi:hypothetical protein
MQQEYSVGWDANFFSFGSQFSRVKRQPVLASDQLSPGYQPKGFLESLRGNRTPYCFRLATQIREKNECFAWLTVDC